MQGSLKECFKAIARHARILLGRRGGTLRKRKGRKELTSVCHGRRRRVVRRRGPLVCSPAVCRVAAVASLPRSFLSGLQGRLTSPHWPWNTTVSRESSRRPSEHILALIPISKPTKFHYHPQATQWPHRRLRTPRQRLVQVRNTTARSQSGGGLTHTHPHPCDPLNPLNLIIRTIYIKTNPNHRARWRTTGQAAAAAEEVRIRALLPQVPRVPAQ